MSASIRSVIVLLRGTGVVLALFAATNAAVALQPIIVQASSLIVQQARPPQEAVLAPAANSEQALNWSGYVADSAREYTAVTGTWTVPEVQGIGIDSADATWVGIGGVHSHDLIQAGTEAIVDADGAVAYRAWMEMLPASSIIVPFAVAPGDSVTVSVSLVPGTRNDWDILFRNNTSGNTYSTHVLYDSSLSSAEWIQEMPAALGAEISLDDFGAIRFGGGSTIADGARVAISAAATRALTMVNADNQALAVPSKFDASGGFSVRRTNADATPLVIRVRRGKVMRDESSYRLQYQI